MDRVIVARGEALGLWPHYFCPGGTEHAPTIAALFSAFPQLPRALDPAGVRQNFARAPDGHRTCFSGISRVPSGTALASDGSLHQLRQPEAQPGCLAELLRETIARQLAGARAPVLALSGGLDSALILALAPTLPVCAVVTGVSGYCERQLTLETARAFGRDLLEVGVRGEEIVESVPAAIAACEVPLFNLHPVTRFLLARALVARGCDLLVTGDGADQVFAGTDPRNYLPIVGAMSRSAGLRTVSPFLDSQVIAWAQKKGADPQKMALRKTAERLIPRSICVRPKAPRLFPEHDLSGFRSASADRALAAILGEPPASLLPSADNTLWATATILFQKLGGLN